MALGGNTRGWEEVREAAAAEHGRNFNQQQGMLQGILSIILSISGSACRRPSVIGDNLLECQLDVTAGDHCMMRATGDRWGGEGSRLSSP